MARLTAPATIRRTAPGTRRSSEPEEETPGMKMLSPGSYRLFGLVCQAATARARRPISWAQLGHAHRVAAAFNADTPPEVRNALGPALEGLGLTWEELLSLAREAGLEVKWTNE